ncbi:MAG: hypothetical protein RBR65_05200 [Aliarcobacter sp.]|nr:hypothetical protein [Aliarcobacter sp.]
MYNNLTDYNKLIFTNIDRIRDISQDLITLYRGLFTFEDIFSSENSGKTRLNRQVFHDKHELIHDDISKLNECLTESLALVREEIKTILVKYNEHEKVDLLALVFDDINFLNILKMNLGTHGIGSETKNKCLLDIKSLLFLKNKIFNFMYLLNMIDTYILDKYITKLGVEDLINSTMIFEVIDSYGLQFDELKKFDYLINNLDYANEKITSLYFLNPLLELHKRRADNFTYANVKYKTFINYDCDIVLNRTMFINTVYLENIISCFLEQSCMDLIKKELKKGKIQKEIDVTIKKNKKTIQIIVRNNGFDVKNIYKLFLSDIDNKYMLEATNLANMMKGKIDIIPIENEGMQYILTLNVK